MQYNCTFYMKETEPNNNICYECNEIIFLKQFTVFGKFLNVKEETNSGINFCESCANPSRITNRIKYD